MKTLFAIAICLIGSFMNSAFAAQQPDLPLVSNSPLASWTSPDRYTDNTVIPQNVRNAMVYKIYRATSQSGPKTLIAQVTSVNTYRLSPQPSGAHCYTVTASTPGEEGSESDHSNAVCVYVRLPAPTDGRIEAPTDGLIESEGEIQF